MNIASRPLSLAQARRLFTEQGAVPNGLIAEPILRSWRRCAELGFDMQGNRRQEPVTRAELLDLRQRHERLRRLCRPTLTMLNQEARRTGSLVILADAQGLVLDSVGAIEFANRASRVALMPGAPWGEDAAGTNAIGTALVEGRPVIVRGEEHFFAPNRILTCAAVPLIDPHGCTLGVLDLSGDAGHDHRHAMGLVALAAAQIERSLFIDEFADCTLLRFHADPAQLDTPREGVVAFRDGLLVGANQRARSLLTLDGAAIGVYRYDELFDADPCIDGPVVRLRTHAGVQFHASFQQPSSHPARFAHVEITTRPAKTPSVQAALAFRPAYDDETLKALARAVHLADAGIAVLLQGETGVGKEVFARQMHDRSARAGRPFVAVNCAALPESLIESELFGYEEGAFTGARRHGSKGLLRQAEGGTLFLDEIGDMPLNLQARLLRVLQTREVTPLGGGRAVPVDFTLVCATHRTLSPDDPNSAIRADLYFRIAEYTVRLNPLRARNDKREVVRMLWTADGKSPPLPQDVEDALVAYDWPGNYRQLAALLKILRVLGGPTAAVRMDMLPAEVRWSLVSREEQVMRDGQVTQTALLDTSHCVDDRHGEPERMKEAVSACSSQTQEDQNMGAKPLRAVSRNLMLSTLAECGGNMTHAARRLGVHRSTLYRHIGATDARREA